MLLRFDSGATGCFTVSQVTAGRKNCLRFEIAGARAGRWRGTASGPTNCGSAIATGERGADPRSRAVAPRGAAVRQLSRRPQRGLPRHVQAAVPRGLRVAERGDANAPRPFPTFADGHREVLLCEAILESHRERRWVDVASEEKR